MQHTGITGEPRWHAAVAVLVALALYATLPPKVVVGPLWLLPLLILVVLVPLVIFVPRRHEEAPWQRWSSIGIVAVLNAFNVVTIGLLFEWQLSEHHRRSITGEQLLLAAVEIWLMNIIVYALWFWELDGNGPARRATADFRHDPDCSDFLFPQMTLQPDRRPHVAWKPGFLDYVFLSFTNATAFSPTDTFPLTHMAKVLVMTEGMTSLVTIAIIAGRAVNILGS